MNVFFLRKEQREEDQEEFLSDERWTFYQAKNEVLMYQMTQLPTRLQHKLPLCIKKVRTNFVIAKRQSNFKVHVKMSAPVPAGHKPYIWFAFWQQQLARTKCLAQDRHQ